MKRLENESSIIFKYRYENGNIVLGIQTEHELPPKANILGKYLLLTLYLNTNQVSLACCQ